MPQRFLRMVIVKNGIATNASTVVASSRNITAPGSIPTPVKQLCLKMYLNGMGLGGIERATPKLCRSN